MSDRTEKSVHVRLHGVISHKAVTFIVQVVTK
jgi:hypothetical protein